MYSVCTGARGRSAGDGLWSASLLHMLDRPTTPASPPAQVLGQLECLPRCHAHAPPQDLRRERQVREAVVVRGARAAAARGDVPAVARAADGLRRRAVKEGGRRCGGGGRGESVVVGAGRPCRRRGCRRGGEQQGLSPPSPVVTLESLLEGAGGGRRRAEQVAELAAAPLQLLELELDLQQFGGGARQRIAGRAERVVASSRG